ncbi:Monoacylglycerol lipase abhd12 [Irineochytrium annulatum]|nr:Monoacylglycerol lipase abhd12 [Irineochytrium annulatum]
MLNFPSNPSSGLIRSVIIETADNMRLGAWHILPHRLAPPLLQDLPTRNAAYFNTELKKADRVFLYFHGNAGNRATFVRPSFYKALSGLGGDGDSHVLTIDYRGFGDSESVTPSEAGIREDSVAAFRWLTRHGVEPSKVFIVGHSLGSGVAAFLARNLTVAGMPPAGLVIVAGYRSIPDAALHYPMVPLLMPFRYHRALGEAVKTLVTERWETHVNLRDGVDCPIILFHGTRDNEIGFWHARDNFLAAVEGRHKGMDRLVAPTDEELAKGGITSYAGGVFRVRTIGTEARLWTTHRGGETTAPERAGEIWLVEIMEAGHNAIGNFNIFKDGMEEVCLSKMAKGKKGRGSGKGKGGPAQAAAPSASSPTPSVTTRSSKRKGRGKTHAAGEFTRNRYPSASRRPVANHVLGNLDDWDDEAAKKMTYQLECLGLRMKDMTGDGNCLFRALADQIDGNPANHPKYRAAVCDHLHKYRNLYEVFVVDETYDQHLTRMRKDGIYGENMELVACARLHRLDICIHQLGQPPWVIKGSDFVGDGASSSFEADPTTCSTSNGAASLPSPRMIHIIYHSFEHYSSVRSIDDALDRNPTGVRMTRAKAQAAATASESKGAPVIRIRTNKDAKPPPERDPDGPVTRMERTIMKGTGCEDLARIRGMLRDNLGEINKVMEVLCEERDKREVEEAMVEAARVGDAVVVDGDPPVEADGKKKGKQDMRTEATEVGVLGAAMAEDGVDATVRLDATENAVQRPAAVEKICDLRLDDESAIAVGRGAVAMEAPGVKIERTSIANPGDEADDVEMEDASKRTRRAEDTEPKGVEVCADREGWEDAGDTPGPDSPAPTTPAAPGEQDEAGSGGDDGDGGGRRSGSSGARSPKKVMKKMRKGEKKRAKDAKKLSQKTNALAKKRAETAAESAGGGGGSVGGRRESGPPQFDFEGGIMIDGMKVISI